MPGYDFTPGLVLPQAAARQQPTQQQPAAPGGNPYDAMLAQHLQELQDMDSRGPQLSPEVIQQRRDANQREYELGIIGAMSGNPALKEVSGMVLKNAIAARQPRITERGTADPITGEYTYDPDYLRQQKLAKVQAIMQLKAAADLKIDADRKEADLKRELLATRGQQAVNVHVGNEPLVQTQDADGNVVWTPRSQAAGMKAPPKVSASHATGDERNSAGFADSMETATKSIDANEARGRSDYATFALGTIPGIGGVASGVMQTPEQQQYHNASMAWIRAKLRRESGAAIGKDEARQEYETYFPLPQDGPEVIAQKRALRAVATRAMRNSAGRANVPAAVPGAPADPGAPPAVDPNDRLGIRAKLLGK